MKDKKERIAIISGGYLPIPAVQGGAVESLDENLILQNEISDRARFVIFSCSHPKAVKEAEKYKNSEFYFIKIPAFIQLLDRMLYFIANDILKLKKHMSYRCVFQRFYYIEKVALALKKDDYDKVVLENHAILFLSLKRYQNDKKYAGRYYYHLHNAVSKAHGCREIIANCKKVIGVSNYMNTTLREFLGKDDHNTYCVLKNMIDRERFLVNLSEDEKRQIRQRFGIGDEDRVILFSGRLDEEKGIRELLQAFSKTEEEHWKLLIVGGYFFDSGVKSGFEKELQKKAENIKDRVIFTGFVPYERMPEMYAVADLAVVPSVWDDPAPLTVIESLTSGKALITTDSGGIPEYADDDCAVILRRDGQLVENLAKAIEDLVRDEASRKMMENAVKEKTKDWGIQKFYDCFMECCDSDL